jgi:hypothetical protein
MIGQSDRPNTIFSRRFEHGRQSSPPMGVRRMRPGVDVKVVEVKII